MGDDEVICLSSDDETSAKSLPKKRKIEKETATNGVESATHRTPNFKRKAESLIVDKNSGIRVKRPCGPVIGDVQKTNASRKFDTVNANCHATTDGASCDRTANNSKNAVVKNDARQSFGCDDESRFRHRASMPGGVKEKLTGKSSKSPQENCKPDVKQSSVKTLEILTIDEDEESEKTSVSTILEDKSRDKSGKSLTASNDPQLVRPVSPVVTSSKKSSEKAPSRVQTNSTDACKDKKNILSLSTKVHAVQESGSSKGVNYRTAERNSINGTKNLGSKHEEETLKSEKPVDVEIVETIEISECDEAEKPSEVSTREKKNVVNIVESSRRSSVGQITKMETPKSNNRKGHPVIVGVEESSNFTKVLKFNEPLKQAKCAAEKISCSPKEMSPESSEVAIVAEAATSPDIEIVEAPKSDSSGTCGTMTKIMKTQNSDDPKTQSKDDHREEKDNGAKSCSRIVASLKTDTSKTAPKIDNPTAGNAEIDENLVAEKSKATSKSCDAVAKRITPTTLATSFEFSTEKSNQKICGANNDSPQSSRSKELAKPREIFVPIAGCSKTPDEMFVAQKPREKPKSTPDASFMTKPWMPPTNDESSDNSEASKSNEKHRNLDKPHLVVKTIKPFVSDTQDTFAMFLSLCLQTDRDEGMEKIVGKLKRHYEQLDPEYAGSRRFNDFLNKKREKIIAKGKIYHHIGHIFEEMKMRRRGKWRTVEENDEPRNEAKSSEDENGDDENSEEARRLRSKIKIIDKAMKQCSKKIEQLEIAEVDFDDEDDSNYIQLQRYKQKMVELYTKLCEYTNEHADAGRAYLRPKHLRVTQIPSIDQAINSFINSKLSIDRKKIARGRSFVEGLVFPDYMDILECIGKVNDQQNLGLDKRKQQKMAEEAFTQLGKHLQDARQKDYWDTFSLALENGEDPASKDSSLSEKLLQNQEIAEKNTKAIFEEYVRKQEEKNVLDSESSSNGSQDDDDDEDEDESNEKSSNNDAPSELKVSDDENSEFADENEKDVNLPEVLELIPEVEDQSEKIREDIDENNESMKKISEQTGSSAETEKFPIECEAIDENEETTNEPPETGEKIVEDTQDRVPEVRIDDETNENNNVAMMTKTKMDDEVDVVASEDERKEVSNDSGKTEVQVKCVEADKEEPVKPAIDETTQQEVNQEEADAVAEQPTTALRIRSFAKPPSSWASSQEMTLEVSDVSPNKETPKVVDERNNEKSACTTSITEVSVSPRIVRITRSVPANSKDVTRMPKILPKISPSTKQQPQQQQQQQQLTNCSSIIIAPQNASTFNQTSKITKIVPGQDLTKQITLLPGVTIRPANNHAQQPSLFRQQGGLTNPAIGTVRALNVTPNVRLSGNATSPVNVRVRAVDIQPQSIQVRLGKNLRPATSEQVQVLRLANTNDLARTNGIRVAPSLQAKSSVDHATNQVFRVPVGQTLHSNPIVTSGQNVRIRLTGSGQVSQAPQQQQPQQQILRLSNGQLMRASGTVIRPLGSTCPPVQGITLKNPRFIRISAGNGNAAVVSPAAGVPSAVVKRFPNNGQYRIERVENSHTESEKQSLPPSSTDESTSAVRSSVTTAEQRTNPVLKPNTSNNTPSNDNQRRYRGKRPGHKNFCTVTNSGEPPPKK